MSLDQMDALIKENRVRMITTNIAITLILGLTVGVFIWFFVHVPVNKLIMGTKEVSSGNLEYTIDVPGGDEVGNLARSFNEMTEDLRRAKKEITAWSDTLEKRIEEKTEELENTLEEQIILPVNITVHIEPDLPELRK